MTGMLRLRLGHVGIAVPRLADAARALETLFGAPPSPAEEVPSEGVRISFLDAGGARLEVLEPSGPGPIARFLAGGRSGVHHLSFEVEGVDLGEWFEELRRRGVEVIGDGPRPGGEGRRAFFVHPRSAGGVLIEFTQKEGRAP